MFSTLQRVTLFRSGFLLALLGCLIAFSTLSASAQNENSNSAPMTSPTPASAQPPSDPLYLDYKGVSIGMTATEVREKLGKPKSKGPKQDFYVISDQVTAQVFYRAQKVFAVSVTYVGENSGAPTAMDVLGTEITPRKNGSMHKVIRYPQAGYWVSYSRSAGKSPVMTVTMQKFRTSMQ